jgi:cysteinyl-tRNA synthetase
MFNLNYWLSLYEYLRNKEGENYFRADELREMLRRMGYEIRNTPEGPKIYKHYEVKEEWKQI